jgi:hypothetical protein
MTTRDVFGFLAARAFSAKVGTGFAPENATKQRLRARSLILNFLKAL